MISRIVSFQWQSADSERLLATGHIRLAVPDDDAGPADDIGDLCERFVEVCESAVDPLEICSALEFEGMSDQAVRERYGLPDVFALAERMYRRVPRRPSEPEPPSSPWRSSVSRPALHGLLYGLPTVFFPAATGLLAGRGAQIVMIVALLISWSFSQALAYVGYLRLGQADRTRASRLLRSGMSAGTAGAAFALALATLAASAHTPAFVCGMGLVAYMLGATVLMVLGAEQMLLIVLAPGVLGAATFLLLGRPARLEHAAWGVLAVTPVLALVLAAICATREAGLPRILRRGSAGAVPPSGGLPLRAEALGALPSAGFGLLAAGLLVFPIAASTIGHGRTAGGALLASFPLALSMGAAEWTLIWFRLRTQRLLRATRESRAFASQVRLTLLAALVQYLSAAVVLTAIVCLIAAESHLARPGSADLPQIIAYLALGGAMFVALLLQAFGSRLFPVAACAAALAFEVACRAAGLTVQVAACASLLLVLTAYATGVLGNAVRHAI